MMDDDFLEFIKLGQDREAFIVNYFRDRGIKAVVIPTGERKHIYVGFDSSMYSPYFKVKTIIAHYDRVEESKGANDNSFAVFQLMKWAISLKSRGGVYNVRIIFTDGEESQDSLSVVDQGSFELANVFKKLGIINDEVYVFDCMGRGSVPVISDQILPRLINQDFKKKYLSLLSSAEQILQRVKSYVRLPVAYSDNASFIASGLPAILITMLPEEEVSSYMMNLTRYKGLREYITNKVLPPNMTKSQADSLLPYTWNLFHSMEDNENSLTEESEAIFIKILDSLSINKTMY